jgi:hypothetical protein
VQIRPERPKTDLAFGVFADCLTAVASSAGLLSSGSALPGGTAVTSALTLLRASRYVAELHGGRLTVDCADGLTSLSIAIPGK